MHARHHLDRDGNYSYKLQYITLSVICQTTDSFQICSSMLKNSINDGKNSVNMTTTYNKMHKLYGLLLKYFMVLILSVLELTRFTVWKRDTKIFCKTFFFPEGSEIKKIQVWNNPHGWVYDNKIFIFYSIPIMQI